MNPNTLESSYPDQPALVHVTRGGRVESQHRGAWVVTDTAGVVEASQGACEEAFFARSTIKALQVLPLIETGAAERFGLSDAELALACASHNAEEAHTVPVAGLLERLGYSCDDLQCGKQSPGDAQRREAMRLAKEEPTALHNNCSGKHAGFLALSKHLGVAPEQYLDPKSPSQVMVRDAVASMCDVDAAELVPAIDGCSAPTYRLSLNALAMAFARVANPACLSSEREKVYNRILEAVATYPSLIAGEHKRICTVLSRITKGRLFPKIGAEGVYLVGERGTQRGLAVKLDDGGLRGLHPLLVALLERYNFLSESEVADLASWRSRELRNWSGKVVGSVEVLV